MAKQPVVEDSARTVLSAKRLRLVGNPTLVINADYDLGQISAPVGVGPPPAATWCK